MNFEHHYQQQYEQIYKFCYRFVGDREKAGDLTQDTFLKLYQRMKNGDQSILNTRAWLYKVAGNMCLNLVSQSQLRSEISQRLPMESIEHNTPETMLLKQEKEDLVRKFLYQLKPENRMLLLMYQDGLSYQEMAEATGIPLNSIGKTLWRNIDKIANAIKQTEHEPGRTNS